MSWFDDSNMVRAEGAVLIDRMTDPVGWQFMDEDCRVHTVWREQLPMWKLPGATHVPHPHRLSMVEQAAQVRREMGR